MPAVALSATPLKGVSWMWPDRSRSEVFDLSLAGALISAKGLLGKIKVDQHFEIRLDLDEKADNQRTSIFLKTKVAQISGNVIGLVFESLSSDRRLQIEQVVKDRLFIQNIHPVSQSMSVAHFAGAEWFHAPFDTNIFLWQSNPGYSLEKAIVEYDNCLWIFEQDHPVQVFKSGAATDPAKGYLHIPDILQNSGVKISVGASWLDRLNKCLEIIIQGAYLPGHEDSLRVLQHTLKHSAV